MIECICCGFVYVNPRPDWNILSELYQSYHARNAKGVESWALLMDKVFKETACLIKRQYPHAGKILDIGCGYGHFLNIMRDCGWDTYGLEPSYQAVSYAKTRMLNVVHGTLNEAAYDANSFDVITMFYVLEHLSNPVEALLRVNRTLKPGGLLILRVPHTTPIVRVLSTPGIANNLYDLPFHLSDFSPETIRCILEKTGYETIRTFPGKPTIPENRLERFATTLFGEMARALYWLSSRRFLLPGVSKTTVARKPAILANGQKCNGF